MAESRSLSTFRFLEKLKAGLGAAGLAAILAESLFSSGMLARSLGVSPSASDRLGGLATVAIAVIAFFLASFFTDITEAEARKEFPPARAEDR